MAEAGRRLPRLHVVTDDHVLAMPDFVPRALAVLARGGPDVALHLRGPGAGGRALFDLADRLAAAARERGALVLVNDRVDVALAAGADGVQLGRRSMLPEDVLPLLGGALLVGASVGSPEEALDAAAGGADFVLAGSVYATESHPGRAGTGPDALAGIAAAGVPVVAIGGVTPDRAAEVRRAGAYGAAAIRAVWNAEDPAEAVARFQEALRDGND